MSKVSHTVSGIRKILEIPFLYESFKALVGPKSSSRWLIDFMQVSPNARIVEFGCGTGDILNALPSDVIYTGFDLNEKYLQLARERYGSRATFFYADLRDKEFPTVAEGSCDFILAIGIIHHLSDEVAQLLVERAWKLLKNGGSLITFDGVWSEKQSLFARMMLTYDRGKEVRTAEGYTTLLRSFFDDIHSEIRDDLLRIPYTHFVARATKEFTESS